MGSRQLLPCSKLIMIIKSKKKIEDGLIKAEFEGNYLKATHIQNLTPVMEEAYNERQASIGEGRKLIGDRLERIACIPSIIFAEHPEFIHDEKALRKWLRSDEGKVYRTSTRSI